MPSGKVYHDNFTPTEKYETTYFPGIGSLELTDIPSRGNFIILEERRNQLGLSQQEVAQKAGMQLRQYQRFETGERKLSAATLRIALAVCDVLELDPHRFV